MARKMLILLGLFFLISVSARAQNIALYGGYTFERLGTSPARNLNGVEIAAHYTLMNWLRVSADLDGHFGLPSSPDARTFHFMAGPEISLPMRISPFVHALAGFGSVHLNGDTSSSYAAALGGGVDMRVAPLFSWRVIQVDDVVTHFFGGLQHSPRISTGFLIRF